MNNTITIKQPAKPVYNLAYDCTPILKWLETNKGVMCMRIPTRTDAYTWLVLHQGLDYLEYCWSDGSDMRDKKFREIKTNLTLEVLN
jgi:hypothetical protein